MGFSLLYAPLHLASVVQCNRLRTTTVTRPFVRASIIGLKPVPTAWDLTFALLDQYFASYLNEEGISTRWTCLKLSRHTYPR